MCRRPPGHETRLWLGRDNISHDLDQGLHLRLEWFHYGVEEAVLELLWRRSSSSLASSAASSFVAVPGSAFKTKLPRSEVWRQQVQAKLSRGWNTWMRDSAARHLHLPSYAGVEIFLFDSKTNTTFSKGLVDKCQGTDPRACLVRPGFHSFNGSYTSYEQRTAWHSTGDVAMSVTIASGHVDGMYFIFGSLLWCLRTCCRHAAMCNLFFFYL